MSIVLQKLDLFLTNFIINFIPRNIVIDAFFSFLSLQGLTVIIWLILLLLMVVWQEKRHKEFILYFLLAFITTSFLVNILIKNIVKRDRPYVVNKLVTTNCPKDFSFPSDHAAGAFTGAVVFATFDKKRRYLYFTIATLIAFSRIYLHCHYLFDVVFGALIGYGVGKTFLLSISDRKRI